MSWVSIDKEKCDSCGLCVGRCVRCFSVKEGEISVEANETNCNLCGHCVALCPTMAITQHKMNMDGFVEYPETVQFDTSQFIQFVRERRSHRNFKKKEIPLNDLETLVDLCRYVPTGSNVQTFEILFVRDPERIKKLSDMNVDFFKEMIDDVEQRAAKLVANGKKIPEDLEYALETVVSRRNLVIARDAGMDPIFHKAPAVMIFHSPKLTSTPKDNCVIAAQTVVLAARTMGLETCYIGLFEAAANSYQPLIEELALPSGHSVYSVLILGYPRLKYLRAVDRKPMKVRWE
ncbi:MAG: nitroreductase family protein [Deltaproteobacteria bacterium]|nr:nitroreductase family protein [Deltaproteobacteria bacterium]MBW2140370.1 nitroreductase family protein [Deltaproteobacteria bacterium]